jgi:hypothetical protein
MQAAFPCARRAVNGEAGRTTRCGAAGQAALGHPPSVWSRQENSGLEVAWRHGAAGRVRRRPARAAGDLIFGRWPDPVAAGSVRPALPAARQNRYQLGERNRIASHPASRWRHEAVAAGCVRLGR